jgi:tripartite-type tricarboxylate transporter receptor subunit TctC
MPFIRDGKLRGLVISAPTRLVELPDVPTTAEAGFVDADYTLWIGLFAPAKTSRGTGNATHLNAERFRASAGIVAVHIPVKSGPEALTEVISGRADFYFCPIGIALPVEV